MKIGVLTGGGDCPGLNPAIRAVVRRADEYGFETLGIVDGWAGLLGNGQFVPLSVERVDGLLTQGGTTLGTSRTNPYKNPDHVLEVKQNLLGNGIDALIAIGGDDTLGVASKLFNDGVKTVGIPKTMDNDLSGTDYTIGFHTAVSIVSEALDRIHTTASSHHRVLVVEVMGRDAGWVAVYGGLAGGADYIVIPERPTRIDAICDHVLRRRQHGHRYSIIVVSEGATVNGVQADDGGTTTDAFGHARLDRRNVGELVSREIEKRTGLETRATVLGHLQRGGSPSMFDRVLATRLGVAAVDFVHDEMFGYMPALRGTQIVPCKLSDAVGVSKTADLNLFELAQIFS